ncbi:hypothetical protein FRB99_003567, partial [Tulasnella sp. 403]
CDGEEYHDSRTRLHHHRLYTIPHLEKLAIQQYLAPADASVLASTPDTPQGPQNNTTQPNALKPYSGNKGTPDLEYDGSLSPLSPQTDAFEPFTSDQTPSVDDSDFMPCNQITENELEALLNDLDGNLAVPPNTGESEPNPDDSSDASSDKDNELDATNVDNDPAFASIEAIYDVIQHDSANASPDSNLAYLLGRGIAFAGFCTTRDL